MSRVVALAILALVVVLTAPATKAQPVAEKVPRIGILATGPLASLQIPFDAFMQQLRALGWRNGRTPSIEYRWPDGRADFPALAADLVRRRVDVIVALGTPAALAAKQAAAGTTPIVAIVGDAVGTGLVTNLARPGGNITGVSDLTAELSAKRLEILKEILPGLSRVAVLWNAANPGAARTWEETAAAAKALALWVDSLPVRAPEELERALDGAAAANPRAGALLVVQDPLTMTYRNRIVERANRVELPAVYGFREFVEAGGLMSYAADRAEIYRTLGKSVDRILKGADPGDLPVEQPTKFELVINIKTAKALGIAIPSSLLARADEVIE